MSRLLVVDDEESICWGLKRLGESLGHEVVTASSAEEAIECVPHVRPDVVLLDVRLPRMNGLAAMPKLQSLAAGVPIIVMTAYGDLETAVCAIRQGAFDYVVKPFDLQTIEHALQRALAAHQAPAPAVATADADPQLYGRSSAMQRVFKEIAMAANSEAGILLSGESGTGKELAARAIHAHSQRAAGPFVAVNLASLSPTLAESELFGHVRGAFTGAEATRDGLLRQADGGTLFLDEVADIPLPLQVKLLRCLEYGEVTPVGSSQRTPTDFRVISATHRDLPTCIQEGTFRHDLYFRLGAFCLQLPALRERREDVRELAERFLSEAASHSRLAPPALAPEAVLELERRPWWGNVRELKNAMEHAVLVSRGNAIHVEHLPRPYVNASRPVDCHESLAAAARKWAEAMLVEQPDADDLHVRLLRIVEAEVFRVLLQHHGGQYISAARQLGIHRTTLKKRLDELSS